MTRPQGRDEVTEAVAACAVDLLAEVGPAGTSVRAVAERAGVNHALIYRHLGNKQALIRLAIARSATAAHEAVQRETRNGLGLAELGNVFEVRRHVQLLSRCLLELPDHEGLQVSFPTVRDVRDSGIAHGVDAETAQARAVLFTAAISGVVLFGPWYADAAELPDGAFARVTQLLGAAFAAVDAQIGMPPWPSVWVDEAGRD